MIDRNQRYAAIRRKLNYPKIQAPTPDQIVGEMLESEHKMNMRLTQTSQSWNIVTHDLLTVAGTEQYLIPSPVSSNQSAGKVYMVLRETGETQQPYLPIAFDDFSHQEYGNLPVGVNSAGSHSERIAFYRKDVQHAVGTPLHYAKIAPTPQEVLTYKIYFHVGVLDRLEAAMDKVGIIPELADYMNLDTLVKLCKYAEWTGNTREENLQDQRNYRESFIMEIADLRETVDDYIDQINSPTIGYMPTWREMNG